MRVLVAERDRNGRRLLEQVLKLEGHEVLSAVDGEHARDLLSTFAPDVVLLNTLSSLSVATAAPADGSDPNGSLPVFVMSSECAENLLSGFKGKNDKPLADFDRLSSRTKIGVIERIQHFCGALSRCRDVCVRASKPENIYGSALDGMTEAEFAGTTGKKARMPRD